MCHPQVIVYRTFIIRKDVAKLQKKTKTYLRFVLNSAKIPVFSSFPLNLLLLSTEFLLWQATKGKSG